MPPKRKRDDNAAASEVVPSTTRRSTRQSASKSKIIEAESDVEPEPKKPKKATAAKSAKSKKAAVENDEDEEEVEAAPAKKPKARSKAAPKAKATKAASKVKSSPDAIAQDHAVESSVSQPPPLVKATPKSTPAKREPYTVENAEKLFSIYADSDNPTVIGPEGFEKLCTAAELNLEGATPMILSWQMESKEMLKLHKDGWMKWTGQTKISSLVALRAAVVDLENLLLRKEPIQKLSKDDLYDREHYLSSAHDPDLHFTKLYTYCFTLAKPAESRNLEMETAVAFWDVLLAPKYPIAVELLEYIRGNASYKAANKDLWSMILEFCRTVSPNLDNFDEDEAWPTLLDGFVAWKKEKMMDSAA